MAVTKIKAIRSTVEKAISYITSITSPAKTDEKLLVSQFAIDKNFMLAKCFDDFLRLMQESGYKVKEGKCISFRVKIQINSIPKTFKNQHISIPRQHHIGVCGGFFILFLSLATIDCLRKISIIKA